MAGGVDLEGPSALRLRLQPLDLTHCVKHVGTWVFSLERRLTYRRENDSMNRAAK
jgi:hypothetical protein